ncbi:MAG: hypothetical protein ACRCSG_09050, partial [Cellulosilyticaceae bacterium]
MLINEPYNLIRDKLNIPRIHKSKYDFMQGTAIATNAMANGTAYEPLIMQEVRELKPNENLVYEDNTFKLNLIDASG